MFFCKSTKTPQPIFALSRAFLIFSVILIDAWDVEYCCLYYSTNGVTPVHKSRRKGWINLPVASKFHFLELIIFYKKVYILFGPEILEFREDIMLAISSLLVVCRNIVLPFLFAR